MKRSNKRTKKHQKLWNMKGCSPQKGGCNDCFSQKGGSTALVGTPWTSSISTWPGVAGVDGVTNHYALNKYLVDPQTQTVSETNQQTYMAKGGKRRIKRSTKGKRKGKRRNATKKGGGIIPQDLLNLGRGMTYGLGSAYNSLSGYSTPINPLPYKDQLISKY